MATLAKVICLSLAACAIVAQSRGICDATTALQISSALPGATSEAAPTITEPKKITPIYYLHIPKSGSSIATTITHFACGQHIAENKSVKEPRFDPNVRRCKLRTFRRPPQDRPFQYFYSGHKPLDSQAPLEHVVAMFRSPKQRIISGYHHGLHDCEKGGLLDIRGYAACVEGCVVNMLTGQLCNSSQHTEADVAAAAAKVPHLGFVGLTEHWALSICLWHAMFGGECLPVEFENVRPGRSRGNGTYDPSALGNWTPRDEAVYAVARQEFQRRLLAFGVTPETCPQDICPRAASIIAPVPADSFLAKVDSSLARDPRSSLGDYDWAGEPAFNED